MEREPAQSSSRQWTLFVLTALSVLVIDGVTKVIVSRALGPGGHRSTVELFAGLVELSYTRNDGIAFGMLQGSSMIVWIAVSLALLLGAWFVVTSIGDASPFLAVGLGLCAGGALGNIINRMVSGYVIDFIEIGRWPSFNVADAALTVGLIVVLVAQFRPSARPVS